MTGDVVVRIRPEVRFVARDDGAVLLQIERGRYQSLNRAGAAIWKEIAGGARAGEIVSRLCGAHPGVARERVERDVEQFLAQLAARGLVTLEGAP